MTGLRIPDETRADGPAWLAALRRDAAARLRETGFPTRKTEAWRFTPVKPVTSVPFETPARDGAAAGWTVRSGPDVRPLREVLERDPESVAEHLGKLAAPEHFAALNAALFHDGLVVVIPEGARLDTPIELEHAGVPGAGPTAAYPRVLVIAGARSEATLVETYLVREGEKHLTNAVTEVVLGEDAKLDHTRVHEGAQNGFHLGTLAVRQGRSSRYASHVVTLGGALTRLDLGVELAGEGAECTLDGVYHVRGDDHVDHQTRIDHAKPHCTSHESYRGVLDGRGHAVFNGIIVVRRDAQRTSAHQENRNLLLSDDAVIHTKPHLEIDADDVKCGHGATIGALDETALFYLRTRGISEDEARDILTFAFVQALLDRIPHAPVRTRLARALLARLPNGDRIEELVR